MPEQPRSSSECDGSGAKTRRKDRLPPRQEEEAAAAAGRPTNLLTSPSVDPAPKCRRGSTRKSAALPPPNTSVRTRAALAREAALAGTHQTAAAVATVNTPKTSNRVTPGKESKKTPKDNPALNKPQDFIPTRRTKSKPKIDPNPITEPNLKTIPTQTKRNKPTEAPQTRALPGVEPKEVTPPPSKKEKERDKMDEESADQAAAAGPARVGGEDDGNVAPLPEKVWRNALSFS